MAFLGGIETIDLSPYVSAGTAAAGPSLSDFGGSESYQDTSYNYGPQQSAAATPSWSTSQTFGDALPGLQAAGHENIMEALAAYNAAKQQEYFFTPATGAGIAALSPTTANDLMIRSMTTGVPTQEFNKYGGYDVVKSLYDKTGGSYGLESISPQRITDLAKIIAGQGFGNYATLIEAGIPDLRVNWTPQQLSFGQQLFQSNPTTEQLFNVSSRLGFSPDQMANLLYQSSGADFKNTLEKIKDYLIRERKSLPGGYRYDLSQFPKTGIESLLKDSGQKFETYAGLEPGQAGIDKLIGYDPTKITNLPSLYQAVLGRAPDTGGLEFYKALAEGGISPEEYREFLKAAQPELQVQQAFQSVLGRKADIPGLEYYTPLVQSGAIAPENLQSSLAYGARSLADQLAAQQFLGKEVFGTPEQLRSTFTTEYGKTLEDVIGKAQDIAQIEQIVGAKPGDLSGFLSPTKWEQAGNIEDIRKKLQESPINKAQEAARTAAVFKNVYGLTDEQVRNYTTSLFTGKDTDDIAEQYFKESLTGRPSLETQQKLIQDAAKKNPESEFFKKNPRALVEATPIGEMKRGEETSNTYGVDPLTNLPILHKEAFNKALGKEVLLSGPEDFTNFTKQQWIGADPHSRYGGMLAKGVGIFGVKADQEEVTDFDKIEKQLAKLGGIQRVSDGEGGVYEYVDIPTEGGEPRRVRIEDLFDTGGEFGYNGADRYRLYQDTKQKLANIAGEAKIDPTKYGSTKELYDALNDRLKNTYVWQGRTDTLDPAAAKALGIEDTTDNRKHATILYRDAGDKLIPEKVLKTFDYQDPNTSRGFVGDTLGAIMEILSVPPIAFALGMAGGLPSLLSGNILTGMGYGAWSPQLASAMSSSIFNPAAVGASLGPTLGITDPAAQKLLGTTIVNAGLSGLSTGAATGDLSQAGLAALAGGAGTATQGLTADLIGPTASRMAGSAVSGAIQGKDVTDVLMNQVLSSGLGQLLSSDPTGSTNILAALAPAILTGNISPTDIMRLTQALESERKQGK